MELIPTCDVTDDVDCDAASSISGVQAPLGIDQRIIILEVTLILQPGK